MNKSKNPNKAEAQWLRFALILKYRKKGQSKWNRMSFCLKNL